jgi:geranylgeranyl pyrophosphate synthase
LVCEALGGKIEDTLPACAAFEIAHTWLLIHDDIEDWSEIRRGKPTLHILIGIPHAVNIGDYLNAKSYEALLLGKDIWGIEKTLKILRLFVEMYQKTGEGQATEIETRNAPLSEATVEWYEEMVLKKTGYYSGIVPCAIGSMIANVDEKRMEAIKSFGLNISKAFQIQDDIINVTMKKEEEGISPGTEGGGVGKDFAGDIAEGKRTLILIHAYENANEKDKEILRKLIGKKDIGIEEKMKVIEIMKRYGSIDYAKKCAEDFLQKALNDLRKAIPKEEKRRKLESLTMFLVQRKF